MDKIELVKNAVQQIIEEGNMDRVDTFFSTDYIAHAGDKTYNGHKFIKQFNKQLKNAIPDLKITKLEFLSQSEDSLTWQRTYSGTHKANLRGIPASMKKIKWYDLVISRFENGKIVEEWVASDLAAQLMFKLPRKN